jgi:hypothetical protein
MIALARAISVLVLLGAAAGGFADEARRPAEDGTSVAFSGACYCRAAGALHCTANLSERECRRRCDEALCDDWFWKERLPCWNWGYGG